MQEDTGEYAPVRVHLVGSDINLAPSGRTTRKVRHPTLFTFTLTAAQPVRTLVGEDITRLYIDMQAGGNNVVICADKGQADDPANQVPGVPNPNGLLLTAGNTVPTRIPGASRLWAVGNTFPSQVTCIVVHESEQ